MAGLMRTSNPVLNEKRFEGFSTFDRGMTLQGTVNKTGVLLLCSIATAAWTWVLPAKPAAPGNRPAVGQLSWVSIEVVVAPPQPKLTSLKR